MASLQNLPDLVEAGGNYIENNQELQQLFHQNYQPPLIDLEKLATYPEGTMGKLFAEEMLRSGFDPNLFIRESGNSLKEDNFASYVHNLRLKTHDIHHFITGFDTSIAGEVGLSAFYFSQSRITLSLF